MGKHLDLSGRKFGKLLVIDRSHKDKYNKTHWRCICDCGNETSVLASQLNNGLTKSCGCFHKEMVSRKFKTHGLTKSPEYEVWGAMVQRCTNKHNKQYSDYGGRGITVCKEWLDSFQKFYEDMGKRPSPDLSIERINNNFGYSPDNCKWATIEEQSRNKRVSKESRSGVHGVVWHKPTKRWYAYITVNRKYTYIGSFTNIGDAIEARKQAETKYWNKLPS